MLWRQVSGVQELTRLLARVDLLWCPCTKVSQQALSERFFEQLISQNVDFITRIKAGAAVKVVTSFTSFHNIRDQLIKLGTGRNATLILTLRRVEIRFGKTWYSYITRVLDPVVLPPYVVADLYRRRWRIESAFHTVKRLLGLSYLWTGSINGVKLQVWATWLFYAVLVDLGDAVADELSIPFDRISLVMLYRGLYHFSVAYDQGKATDPVKYFAAKENQDLDVVKALRKPVVKLDLSPFPVPHLTKAQFS